MVAQFFPNFSLIQFFLLVFLSTFPTFSGAKVQLTKEINNYCHNLQAKFKDYRWGESFCQDYQWNHVRNSVQGHPLIWMEYTAEPLTTDSPANKTAPLKSPAPLEIDTTLVLCGVHGDEITPIKLCFDILHHLKHNFHTLYTEKRIVVVPVVNPDSFLKSKPTRTNKNGVDINRNFPTLDWAPNAQKMWVRNHKRDIRRFPGVKPMSEPEVIFQMNLVKRYKPSKIISVHAPLSMLDYDGPGDNPFGRNLAATAKTKDPAKIGERAQELLLEMSKSASGYKVRSFRTYPGSLGNWAGIELKIPTYTLELPTSDPKSHTEYWNLFKGSFHQLFEKNLHHSPQNQNADSNVVSSK
jgi:protein MpaA